MIKIILLMAVYLLFPLVIIWLCRKWSLLKKLGTIVLAYGFGLVLGSIGLFPEGSPGYKLALQGQLSLPSKAMDQLLATGE